MSLSRSSKLGRLLMLALLFSTVIESRWIDLSVTAAEESGGWTVGAGHRWKPLTPALPGKTGFTSMGGATTGVQFTNQLSPDRYLTNQILLNGSGVALGDVDGDGLTDLYLCSLTESNRLYRNLGGWHFSEIPSSAGAPLSLPNSTGASLVDLDGDGDLDLAVNTLGGGTHLFFNDGRGRFSAPATPSLNAGRGGTSMAIADIDGDGDLDLYLVNYRTVTVRDEAPPRLTVRTVDGKPQVTHVNGIPISDPELRDRFLFKLSNGEGGRGKVSYEEQGEADVLLLNDGHGQFTPSSWTEGRFLDEQGARLNHAPMDWGLSALFADLNGDGAPDLYVCNDFGSPDRLWFNDGHGIFRLAPATALRQTSFTSMGVDVADLNRDGFPDLFVVDMLATDRVRRLTQLNPLTLDAVPSWGILDRPQYPRNTLQLNRGDGTFAEVAEVAHLEAADWAWAPVFLDVDLDGYEDLIVTSGFELDIENIDISNQLESIRQNQRLSQLESLQLRSRYPRLPTGNLAFRNGGQLRFEDRTDSWGLRVSAVTQGVALADLDGDGDLDLVISSMNGPVQLYRNDSAAPRLAIQLLGRAPNTRGIGATLRVITPQMTQQQEMLAGGRYLSSDAPMKVFAGFNDETPLAIEVRWRDGKVTRVEGARANRLYVINEATAAEVAQASVSEKTTPWFEDISARLSHRHRDEPFDDFQRQPLLDRQLSASGPGVAWFDLDQDGREDLVISGGKGGEVGLFRNDGQGGFARWTSKEPSAPLARDTTAPLAWRSADLVTELLTGVSGYEETETTALSMFSAQSISNGFIHPKTAGASAASFSTGPMSLGFLVSATVPSLFVGGRAIPGHYPDPCPSFLFQRRDGVWQKDIELSRFLENVGPVSGSVFSDLDGDGLVELILACDGGPIRVFKLRDQKLVELTEAWGLSKYRGWWNGVTTGDFDGDGRLDIVASNWGLNTSYPCDAEHPLRLYHGDLDGDGVTDLVPGVRDPGSLEWKSWHPFFMMGALFPFLQEQFPTHRAYAEASLGQIFGPRLQKARVTDLNWLSSTLFLNRGQHFDPHPLPLEAQLAPGFGISAADLDGDGLQDLILSQNWFHLGQEISRADAGRGLCLKGDGHGGFVAIPGQRSGILVYGEQRGSAVADFDGDGRVDWVVTQNSETTRLFRNTQARVGLRVRLKGPAGNPDGIGAVLRTDGSSGLGPAVELHAGSGYWSQDSAMPVMTSTSPLKGIRIRWPGGRETNTEVPTGITCVTIDDQGQLLKETTR